MRRMLEQWLGLAPAGPGEDTAWSLRFSLGWPDWAVAIFAVAAFLWVFWVYAREGKTISRSVRTLLALLRLAAIALVVVMIGGLELAIDRTGLPYLVFAIDESESMRVRDRLEAGGTDREPPMRVERAVDLLTADEGAKLKELLPRHKVQVWAVGAGARLVGQAVAPDEIAPLVGKIRELKPIAAESRHGDSLREILNSLRGTPPSSVVLLSDGVVTAGESLPQAALFAERKNIPVFAVGVGDARPERDLQLDELLVDDTVFVDDTITFEFRVKARGMAGETARINLLRSPKGGTPDQAKEKVDSKSLPLTDARSETVRLTHRPTEPGEYVYVIEAPPLERELSIENNRIERKIRVVKEKINVLYVDSFPRYEYRFLKNLLDREPTVEVRTLLLDADPDHVRQDRNAIAFFPADRKTLFEFDVVILGDVSPTYFTASQMNDLREFVRTKGGGLMFVAGKDYSPGVYRDTPLGELLPVDVASRSVRGEGSMVTAGVVPALTAEGRQAPMFRFSSDEAQAISIWRSLPPVFWIATPPKAKPGAQVLLEVPPGVPEVAGRPLVATQFFGAGRTYYQGFDSTWRWRRFVEDLYHGRYWVQTIRYLARAKLLGKNRGVELTADRREYRRGDPVQLRVRFIDESMAPPSTEPVRLQLAHERATRQTVELRMLPGRRGVFEGIASASEDGRWQGRILAPVIAGGGPQAEYRVIPPPGELDRVQLAEADLKLLAEKTRGGYLPIQEGAGLFAKLPAGRPVAIQTDPPIQLWNTWPVLMLFVALLAAEWLIRKACQLV
jgi:hypothetical protein